MLASNQNFLPCKNAGKTYTTPSIKPKHCQPVIFCSTRYEKSTPEVALFRAVILQAIIDAVNNSKRTEDMVAKKSALEWLNLYNEDFLTVCDLAKMSANGILSRFGYIVKNTSNRYSIPSR